MSSATNCSRASTTRSPAGGSRTPICAEHETRQGRTGRRQADGDARTLPTARMERRPSSSFTSATYSLRHQAREPGVAQLLVHVRVRAHLSSATMSATLASVARYGTMSSLTYLT